MKRMFAGVLAVGAVGCAAGLGEGVSAADDAYGAAARSSVGRSSTARVVYAVGGARAPDIPWYDYTERAGTAYYPGAKRTIVDYPAAAAFNWLPDMYLPAGGRESGSIGQAVDVAAKHLDADIRGGAGPAGAVGLSEGALGLDLEQMRLAGDPSAPPPDKVSFTEFGDPTGRNAFGASMLAHIFGPGSYIPVIDYTMPKAVDSQYDNNKVVTAYDGLSDFPDRPDNLVSLANAAAGAALVHTPTAFTSPGDVPSTNIRATGNAKGGTTTTYLIPVDHLPLTLPLRYLGVPPGFVDQIDSVLQPMADAGYARNDNPATKPVSVDPVHGMDPIALLDPASRDSINKTFGTIRGMIPSIG
ncbi:PE-PPE domain-containing protein [Mycobacterium sp. URHB0021]